ncbi:TPA: restriction endonuclease subunit S [Acinetobacter baumannii]|nr:restriction endonuclease subunit S [Acinetobacter baumannii]
MSTNELPEGWIHTKLGKVVDYGKATKCNLEDVQPDTWVLELEDIEKGTSKLIQRIEASNRPFKSTKNVFKTGDVLYGKLRPYLNKVLVAETDGVCTTEIVPIDAEPFVNNRYLFYWFRSGQFLNYVEAVSYGVNMPRLGTKEGIDAPLVLAPIAEQKVIADKLDILLAQVESIKARLERIPEILKQLRQSVLAAAVTGKLTEEWRGNVSYSRMDLKLIKSNILIDIPTTWIVKKLKDSCDVVSGNAFKSGDFLEKGDVPAIKISNVQYGEFEEKNQQYLPSHFIQEFKGFIVKPDDVLMALTRPITNNTLKVCRYPKSQPVALLNQRVAKFDFKDELEKAFFELLFQSNYFKGQVIDNLSETLQPNLSPVDLKSFLIGVPPPNEQVEIVRLVAGLFRSADVIERQVQSALNRVNNLTQSILAKAFRGELTAEWREANPYLISGENSVEALLERIKAERTLVKSATKRGGSK